MDDTELDKLLTEWHTAVQNSDYWTTREMELRKQIFNGMFTNPVVGTNKVRIGHGMALIGDYRMNYKIDKAVLEASRGFIPIDILESVISYRPEVKVGGWKKLSNEDRKHFGAFVTETPGSPGLELKPANKVRW